MGGWKKAGKKAREVGARRKNFPFKKNATMSLETLTHVFSIMASVGALLAPAAAAYGAFPRAGPMRALVLGVTGKLPILRPSFPASQRAGDCEALMAAIRTKSPEHYIVVTGPKVRGDGPSTSSRWHPLTSSSPRARCPSLSHLFHARFVPLSLAQGVGACLSGLRWTRLLPPSLPLPVSPGPPPPLPLLTTLRLPFPPSPLIFFRRQDDAD
jgi:hypothetical protein